MIIDLDQEILIFDKNSGLHVVKLINIENKTVVTKENVTFNWDQIQFMYEI